MGLRCIGDMSRGVEGHDGRKREAVIESGGHSLFTVRRPTSVKEGDHRRVLRAQGLVERERLNAFAQS